MSGDLTSLPWGHDQEERAVLHGVGHYAEAIDG